MSSNLFGYPEMTAHRRGAAKAVHNETRSQRPTLLSLQCSPERRPASKASQIPTRAAMSRPSTIVFGEPTPMSSPLTDHNLSNKKVPDSGFGRFGGATTSSKTPSASPFAELKVPAKPLLGVAAVQNTSNSFQETQNFSSSSGPGGSFAVFSAPPKLVPVRSSSPTRAKGNLITRNVHNKASLSSIMSNDTKQGMSEDYKSSNTLSETSEKELPTASDPFLISSNENSKDASTTAVELLAKRLINLAAAYTPPSSANNQPGSPSFTSDNDASAFPAVVTPTSSTSTSSQGHPNKDPTPAPSASNQLSSESASTSSVFGSHTDPLGLSSAPKPSGSASGALGSNSLRDSSPFGSGKSGLPILSGNPNSAPFSGPSLSNSLGRTSGNPVLSGNPSLLGRTSDDPIHGTSSSTAQGTNTGDFKLSGPSQPKSFLDGIINAAPTSVSGAPALSASSLPASSQDWLADSKRLWQILKQSSETLTYIEKQLAETRRSYELFAAPETKSSNSMATGPFTTSNQNAGGILGSTQNNSSSNAPPSPFHDHKTILSDQYFINGNEHFRSITAASAFRNDSFEELRLRDYQSKPHTSSPSNSVGTTPNHASKVWGPSIWYRQIVSFGCDCNLHKAMMSANISGDVHSVCHKLGSHIEHFATSEPYASIYSTQREAYFVGKVKMAKEGAAHLAKVTALLGSSANNIMLSKIANEEERFFKECLTTWMLFKHAWQEKYEGFAKDFIDSVPSTPDAVFRKREEIDVWEKSSMQQLERELGDMKKEFDAKVQGFRDNHESLNDGRAACQRLLSTLDTL